MRGNPPSPCTGDRQTDRDSRKTARHIPATPADSLPSPCSRPVDRDGRDFADNSPADSKGRPGSTYAAPDCGPGSWNPDQLADHAKHEIERVRHISEGEHMMGAAAGLVNAVGAGRPMGSLMDFARQGRITRNIQRDVHHGPPSASAARDRGHADQAPWLKPAWPRRTTCITHERWRISQAGAPSPPSP